VLSGTGLLLWLFAQKPDDLSPAALEGASVATFAGGCFWCVEADFEKVGGVIEAISGFTGGDEPNPSYKEVSAGLTGHVEAVQVYYDPARLSYTDLLEIFWTHIDPTDSGGQFVDRGAQYRSAIFYHDKEQKHLAEESKRKLASSGIFDRPVVTEIRPLKEFYQAEDYHQDYYKTHPLRYRFYRFNSGRDQFLEDAWADREFTLSEKPMNGEIGMKYQKPNAEKIKEMLTPLQYKVTQKDATDPAFQNQYWDNKEEGIY